MSVETSGSETRGFCCCKKCIWSVIALHKCGASTACWRKWRGFFFCLLKSKSECGCGEKADQQQVFCHDKWQSEQPSTRNSHRYGGHTPRVVRWPHRSLSVFLFLLESGQQEQSISVESPPTAGTISSSWARLLGVEASHQPTTMWCTTPVDSNLITCSGSHTNFATCITTGRWAFLFFSFSL